ncbi:glycosyltransferase family 1 protein [Actinomyces minihominis]|uniref:glycosyltransferase family 1 protein n=1 Tax=Actinomyces minihominis TaxID=2002838 RepID=UPI000C089EE4|nr:glycosyltransferase family 1 protein [Actinomyces minihominis]
MNIAIKRSQTEITEDGRIAGFDAGATLVRRFLRLFPGAQVIGTEFQRCDGFDVVPLEFIDPTETLIINMDVFDSPAIWNQIYTESGGATARIMNFVWWPLTRLERPEQSATVALSCALFPTFANSERTASEVQELVAKGTVPHIAHHLELGWVNLGFRLDHVQPRVPTEVPIVRYPAIYLSPRKRPDLFLEIVERVQERTPLEVEMRLEEETLVSEKAMRISRLPWVWVGPLTSTRSGYWESLSQTTAFLATAEEESYGLTYVEALGAGAIGVFPDIEWARQLLPEDYPFLYSNKEDAEEMLYRAVTDPDLCRAEMDDAVAGSFTQWINQHHSDDTFDREVTQFVSSQFE